jgi:hypothetical protein
MATQQMQDNTVETPPATPEELKAAFDQLVNTGKVTIREDSKPSSTKRHKIVGKTGTPNPGGSQNAKFERWANPITSVPNNTPLQEEPVPETEPEEPESKFSVLQLQRIEKVEALRLERRGQYAAVLENIQPSTPLHRLMNTPVEDNALCLLALPINAGKGIDWAIGFIEYSLQPTNKLMLLLERWLEKASSVDQKAQVIKPVQQAPTPKQQLDYSSLVTQWEGIRERCGVYYEGIVINLTSTARPRAALLYHGPKAWATTAVEKAGQPEQQVYDTLTDMLNALEGALEDCIKRQEEIISGQLTRLEEKRLKFLADAGFEQPRDVPVAQRMVLCTTIEEQYQGALTEAGSASKTMEFLREELDIAMEFASSNDTPKFTAATKAAANHAALLDRAANGDSDASVKKQVSLGPVPNVGLPNPQGPTHIRRGTVDGIGGGAGSRKVRQGRKSNKDK